MPTKREVGGGVKIKVRSQRFFVKFNKRAEGGGVKINGGGGGGGDVI